MLDGVTSVPLGSCELLVRVTCGQRQNDLGMMRIVKTRLPVLQRQASNDTTSGNERDAHPGLHVSGECLNVHGTALAESDSPRIIGRINAGNDQDAPAGQTLTRSNFAGSLLEQSNEDGARPGDARWNAWLVLTLALTSGGRNASRGRHFHASDPWRGGSLFSYVTPHLRWVQVFPRAFALACRQALPGLGYGMAGIQWMPDKGTRA